MVPPLVWEGGGVLLTDLKAAYAFNQTHPTEHAYRLGDGH